MSMTVTMALWSDMPGILTGDFTNVGLDVKTKSKICFLWLVFHEFA